MQVNSVSSAQSFQARNRSNVEAFIHLDDEDISRLAYAKTMMTVDEKRHKRINNALINSIPVVAGLSSALLTGGSTFARLLKFGGVTASWFAGFGVIDLVFAAKNKLNEKSEKLSQFAKNHEFIDFLATAALGIGALYGVAAGGTKLLSKVPENVLGRVGKELAKADNVFKNSKFINVIEGSAKTLLAKTPQIIKNAGKSVLGWMPLIVAGGALAESMSHNTKKAQIYADNYNDLKDKQEYLAKLRIAELKAERDGLL